METCPACKGAKEVFVFADGHHEDGTAFSRNGLMACLTCKGAGSLTDEHVARIAAGKKLRDERVAQRRSLLEVATERGISPAELSAIEMGRQPAQCKGGRDVIVWTPAVGRKRPLPG